jgi:RHS repeat-associated protein
MIKKYNTYIVFFLLVICGNIHAGTYPNYTQNIAVSSLNHNGQTGTGGGTISVINGILSINISATWTTASYFKIGTVAVLTISPALPDMDLGTLSSVAGNPLANFKAKIENNALIFYLTNSPTQWNSCYFAFTKNLECKNGSTWYLDNDFDGLGDPANFLTEQCSKPDGNYVLNKLDNCPTIPGTNANCTTLQSAYEQTLKNQNSIKNISYKVATTSGIQNPTINQADQKITYYDGLGRPIQKVEYQNSDSGKDIVIPIEYDDYGRQVKEYLPFASTQNDSKYILQSVLIPDLVAQYKAQYGTTNSNPFSEKQLEQSPLNRVLQQAAPGNDWALINNHTIKISHQANIANDIHNYRVNAVWNSTAGIYDISLRTRTTQGFYEVNQLYKTVTYDENSTVSPLETDGCTVEFKNKEGQIVLKRTYDDGVKHDTYYVYDQYNNLTYVIPPKAVDLLGTTSAQADLTSTVQLTSASAALHLTASNSIRLLPGFHAQAGSTFSAVIDDNKTVLDNLCYQYKYDYRNRLVEKKLPGKQWEFILYDKLDRVVATGPANSPFSDITTLGWSVTKYDAFNRPVITGWLPATVTTATRKTLQDAQNALTSNFNETKIATPTNTIIPATTGVKFRYDNAAWPTTGYHVMSVSYYDDYNFPDAPATIPTTVAANTAGLSQAVYYNATTKPIGLATGSWIRVPDLSTNYKYEQTYSLYDAKARPVRSYTQNFLGGFTCTDSKLNDFSGQLQYTITTHSRLATDPVLKTTETFTYSAQDRLISQTHQIGTATAETLFTNTYDELGQLVSKKVGGSTQKIDYTYNIRGWLTGINDVDALAKTGDPKDLFAFKINYNTTTTAGVKALYNGNIAETYWSSASEATPVVRGYGYVYDNLNRLRTGIFKQAGTINNFYDETLGYDKNGNIMSLMRNGNPTALQQIDKLTYSYGTANSSNQLTKVVDNATTYKAGGFVDSASNTADDYSYDANGNMTKDNNKNITAITYNHLNLPAKITFGTTGNIVYLYNAAGQKVRKTVTEGTNETITDYLGGYQYVKEPLLNPALKFFQTAEGYVEVSGSSYKYIYQYKDHLGNIRISYDKTLAIKDENNYYPFGLKHMGYGAPVVNSNYKYKYNGKELQDELQLNMYDMKARNYMLDIGRWSNMDELSELFYRNSPYNFSNNNPVFYSDPTGLAPESPNYLASTVVNKRGEIIDYKNDGDTNIYLDKRGGEIVGKERAGVKYEVGNKIVQEDLTGHHVLFSNGIGHIEKLKPKLILLDLPWYVGAPGSGWRTVNIKNFWLTLETFLKGGTMEVKIGLLLNGEEKAGNIIKLLKIMEADAKAAGATTLVLEGKAIMNTKLLNVQAWERLGYTVENVAETSIKVSKKL